MPPLFGLLALTLAAAHGPAKPQESLARLKVRMDQVAAGFQGVLGYSLRGPGGEQINLRGDERFPTASTIKVAVMCEALSEVEEGKLQWSQPIMVQPGLGGREAGGPAYYFRDGSELPLSEWIDLMITMSDNTATIRLRDLLGQENINNWLKAHGFQQTLILNGADTDRLGLRALQRQYGLGVTTPNEMVRLFDMIANGGAASAASCERMIRILGHQYWDDGIASQIPPGVQVASKSGAIDGTRSDVAIVHAPGGDYTLAIYTRDQKDDRWAKDNAGCAAIRTLSAIVWKHFNPASTWTPPTGADELWPTS